MGNGSVSNFVRNISVESAGVAPDLNSGSTTIDFLPKLPSQLIHFASVLLTDVGS